VIWECGLFQLSSGVMVASSSQTRVDRDTYLTLLKALKKSQIVRFRPQLPLESQHN